MGTAEMGASANQQTSVLQYFLLCRFKRFKSRCQNFDTSRQYNLALVTVSRSRTFISRQNLTAGARQLAQTMKILRSRKLAVLTAVIVWISGVALGLRQILAFEYAPGKSGTVSKTLPEYSRLKRHPTLPTLVLTTH
jgi:hypothetical protein